MCVSPDGQPLRGLRPLRALDGGGEDLHAVRAAGEQAAQGQEVLLGEDLGGGHERGLGAVLEHDDHGEERDHRLARSHVPLHQPVHRVRALEVGRDLAQHPLLRFGQAEGQDPLHRLAGGVGDREGGALRALAPQLLLQGEAELEQEQLLEDQAAVPGAAERVQRVDGVRLVGDVHAPQRLAPPHHPEPRRGRPRAASPAPAARSAARAG